MTAGSGNVNPEGLTHAGAQRFFARLSITQLFDQLRKSEECGHARIPRYVIEELARRNVEVVR